MTIVQDSYANVKQSREMTDCTTNVCPVVWMEIDFGLNIELDIENLYALRQ